MSLIENGVWLFCVPHYLSDSVYNLNTSSAPGFHYYEEPESSVYLCCRLLVAPRKQKLLPRIREFRDGDLFWELSSVPFLKNCCRGGTGSWKRMLHECVLCRSDCERFPKEVLMASLRLFWEMLRVEPPSPYTPAWLATNVYSWCHSFSPFRFSALQYSGSDSSHNLNFSSAVRGASCLSFLILSSASLTGSLGMVNLIGIELALFELFVVGKVRVLEWEWCMGVFRVEVIARGFQRKKSLMTCLRLSSETAVGKVCFRLQSWMSVLRDMLCLGVIGLWMFCDWLAEIFKRQIWYDILDWYSDW